MQQSSRSKPLPVQRCRRAGFALLGYHLHNELDGSIHLSTGLLGIVATHKYRCGEYWQGGSLVLTVCANSDMIRLECSCSQQLHVIDAISGIISIVLFC